MPPPVTSIASLADATRAALFGAHWLVDDGNGATRRVSLDQIRDVTGVALWNVKVGASGLRAVGDGVADDGAAIQAVLDACSAAGGGLVYVPAGIYRLATPLGAFCILLRPRSNVLLVGEGRASVFKAGNGLNTTAHNDGYSFIRHVAADEGIATCDNFGLSSVAFDHNGAANLVPAVWPTKLNVALGIDAGANITVERIWSIENPGTQSLLFGNNAATQSVTQLTVRDNVFTNQGGSVTGNTQSIDHSTIYAQAIGATITGNQFVNANAAFKNTALECHSSDAVVSHNVVKNFAVMANIVATVCDQQHVVYSHNTGTGLKQAVVFWAQSSKVLSDVLVAHNVAQQAAGAASSDVFVDLSTHLTTPADSVAIIDNTLTSLVAGGTATAVPGCTIGNVNVCELARNRWRGFSGRAVELGTIPVSNMHLVLEDNSIVDCGTTTDANYRKGIDLRTLNTIAYLRIARNRTINRAATYMTDGVGGNAPVTQGEIEGNTSVGIATPLSWSIDTNLRVDHAGTGVPGIRGLAGSVFRRTNGGAGTSLYVKEANAGTTWVAK